MNIKEKNPEKFHKNNNLNLNSYNFQTLFEYLTIKEKKPFISFENNDDTLIFESRFESGNLCLAFQVCNKKISKYEYNLLLSSDSNLKNYSQCFK